MAHHNPGPFSRSNGLHRCVFLLLLLVIPGLRLAAQEPTPTPVPDDDRDLPIKVKTDLVTLTLTVTDLYGRYVSGLSKKAFTVTDNNEVQDITFFSDTDAPVSIGILFDVSGSMSGEKIGKARKALEKFIATSHPSDEYYLIAFNNRAQLLTGPDPRRRCGHQKAYIGGA